jgi:GntR family transcriptional repressor for pyruvate dehydrogenase complex
VTIPPPTFRSKRATQVAEYLESLIIQRVYQPGEKLPSLDEMAQMLKVSKSTIREALAALAALDLIDIRHGRGYFVKNLTGDLANELRINGLHELLFVRRLLEVPIAGLAAQHRTDDHLKTLRHHLDLMRNGDADDRIDADWAFHLTLAAAANVTLLETILRSLAPLARQNMRYSRALVGTPDDLFHRHFVLYRAIVDQDSKRAEEYMSQHFQDAVARLNKLLPHE